MMNTKYNPNNLMSNRFTHELGFKKKNQSIKHQKVMRKKSQQIYHLFHQKKMMKKERRKKIKNLQYKPDFQYYLHKLKLRVIHAT